MFKYSLPSSLLFCFLLTCSTAIAQNLCPPGVKSDKLICLLPQVYGVDGLSLGPNGEFHNFLTDGLRPLNSALGRQAILVPLASPSSGITYSWNEKNELSRSTDSFGPIYGERAETIGKYQVFVGLDYQYIKFSSLDAIDLRNIPVVLTQQDTTVGNRTCSIGGDNKGTCSFIRDVIKTENRIDLKIHQFTTFITFGVTDRIDVSVAIPIEDIHMGVISNATIVDNSHTGVHTFPFVTGCGNLDTGELCLTQSFPSARAASGIGDITLRVKGTAWKGKRGAFAIGGDIRVPTGDALDFLGAGAAGVKPFVVWSYRARISPHVLVGYETNGSSVLSGDISTGAKARLPGQLTYSSGADIWLTKWFTTAFDLVGQQVFEAPRSLLTSFIEPKACLDPTGQCATPPGLAPAGNTDINLSQATESFNITNLSVGAKVQGVKGLLFTGNLLVKLNDGGLRSGVIPLLGISYTF